MNTPNILVLGLGSAGKRHAGNLHNLGCACVGFDPREDRRLEFSQSIQGTRVISSLEEVELAGFAGFVLASPPAFHLAQIQLIRGASAAPILCEKPLGVALDAALALPEKDRQNVLLGYTYRWWPPLRDLRQRVQAGEIGVVRHVKCTMAAHLADWHPWEDYRDFFMSSAAQGGGALLDESHIVDLLIWIFGLPEEVWGNVEKISDLDISTDDNVDLLMRFPLEIRANVHLDLFARPHERSIQIVGEKGTLRWSYERNVVEVSSGGAGNWSTVSYSCERNEMFMGVAAEFLRAIRTGQAGSCDYSDGVKVLSVLAAAKASAHRRSAVRLEETLA